MICSLGFVAMVEEVGGGGTEAFYFGGTKVIMPE